MTAADTVPAPAPVTTLSDDKDEDDSIGRVIKLAPLDYYDRN